jgi:PEP-CTERM motif
MKNKTYLLTSLIAAFGAVSSYAQTTWTGAGDGVLWSDDSNWSNSQPSATSASVFNTPDVTAIDSDYTLQGVTFSTGISSATKLQSVGGSAITINAGGIINPTAFTPEIQSTISAGANQTWDGPVKLSGIINLGVRTVTITDSAAFTGTNLNVDMTSATTFGKFIGTGSSTFTSSVRFTLNSTFSAFTAGQSFDFTTGSFTNVILNPLPTLTGPILWDTSQFASQGILSIIAVPEPSTYAILSGVAVLGLAAYRRRKIVSA